MNFKTHRLSFLVLVNTTLIEAEELLSRACKNGSSDLSQHDIYP